MIMAKQRQIQRLPKKNDPVIELLVGATGNQRNENIQRRLETVADNTSCDTTAKRAEKAAALLQKLPEGSLLMQTDLQRILKEIDHI